MITFANILKSTYFRFQSSIFYSFLNLFLSQSLFLYYSIWYRLQKNHSQSTEKLNLNELSDVKCFGLMNSLESDLRGSWVLLSLVKLSSILHSEAVELGTFSSEKKKKQIDAQLYEIVSTFDTSLSRGHTFLRCFFNRQIFHCIDGKIKLEIGIA